MENNTTSRLLPLFPGISLSVGLALLAYGGSLLSKHLTGSMVAGPILLAILLGVLVRNLLPVHGRFEPGIHFSFRRLLRLGVIGLGFDFSAHEILSVGLRGLLLDLLVIAFVYGAAVYIGRRRGLPDSLSLLLGTGTAICGASAIVAANSVIRARDEEVAFSVATVTIFGTLSMFLFPLANRLLHLPDPVYGAWAGSSIHEIGQVIGATLPYSHESLRTGTVLKLTRVALLLPVVLLLEAMIILKSRKGERGQGSHAQHFPWFVAAFAGVVLMNFMVAIPASLLSLLQKIDAGILAVAMVGMGLETHLSRLVRFGWKPVGLGFLLWVSVSGVGLALAILLYGPHRPAGV